MLGVASLMIKLLFRGSPVALIKSQRLIWEKWFSVKFSSIENILDYVQREIASCIWFGLLLTLESPVQNENQLWQKACCADIPVRRPCTSSVTSCWFCSAGKVFWSICGCYNISSQWWRARWQAQFCILCVPQELCNLVKPEYIFGASVRSNICGPFSNTVPTKFI